MDVFPFLRSLGIADPLGIGFLSVVLTFVSAWVFTHRFVPRVRDYAIKVGWADLPNERRLNKAPLPNAGGLAIFAGFIIPVVIVWALRPIGVTEVQVQVLAILLGATLMVMLGFIDDQFTLPPLFRLGMQTVAALLLVLNGLSIELLALPFLPVIPVGLLEPFNIFFTLLWIVGITNAFNLLDGVDGVVGGIGFIASVVMLAVAAQFPDRGSAVVLLAGLAGAALGFLRHNFNPSRIIMGDGGAYLFGYTLAAISLLGTLKVSAGTSLLAPLLFLALPIIDTTQVIVGRLLRGQNPLSTPDKTHIHHRLFARYGARGAAVIIWAITLGFNIVGMLAQGIPAQVIFFVTLGVGGCLTWVALRRVRALRLEESHVTVKEAVK
ncbi:MraY family glycosyltransferase [Deinococcus peraridilitoris]|uniref:UDP-N-acetylmuramyl pentapeptide phosphotransferase/UDP-N-acetylglucosamine-1-phosphate transferase n=1 Tax=Deinococcus peraridilitoris (strain DSM 19664 / LMG 22246 / CIP 109416 / KR-200) TaxID=937777 RepID=L0A5E6_DEIPD|nr:MraY family glycosyltransferase [Deinococcus peraridilitoris]AFZ68649.1 UDP-N-acetylmuramyl pentapeptide phosphotransferase/UDP-N-acetylglucosamine-1-phosphate transferase [Deinococcus peraridilitoris DSM 19664]